MSKIAVVFSFSVLFLTSLFAAKDKKEQVPLWVQDPSFIYSSSEYLSNLGQGKSQKQAETDALSGLAAIFNQSIESNTRATVSYMEASGTTDIEKSKSLKQDLKISTNVEELIGVEIKERWKSQDGTFYALAIIEKKTGVRLYYERVRASISDIDKLLDVAEANRGTFTGYFKYHEASKKATRLQADKGCLAVLDSSGISVKGIRSDTEYSPLSLKIQAEKVAKSIEVFVAVSPEAQKLKPHIEKVFSKYSFTLSKKDSVRYRLLVRLDLDEPIELSQGRMSMRYNLEIELVDNAENETILPFAFEGKETHFDMGSVKNKIFKTLEKKAMDEFYLSFAKFASVK